MPHYTPLITTIVAALTLAWAFAAVAHRLKLPPLVGYLLAGIAIGPFTPGFVADQNIANELAEIGVILLMFGVGLHFSLEDLLSVRKIAVPGALAQILCATLLGAGLAMWLGWPLGAGLVFGLALSVASTVVLLRALQERRLIETERGRIAVGWLIVEDIAMVLALVLLPVIAGLLTGAGAGTSMAEVALAIGLTGAKIAAFVAIMLIVGKRVIPWILHAMAHSGSRELFRLSVLAIALGTAFGAAMLFGVSFALGAFFAGMILSESKLSQQAATETLPLRDAFAVLFFVSVGMLADPMIVVREPVPVMATVFIVVVGKSLAAYAIVRVFGYSNPTALTISASLAQIGEFSFILANLGVDLALLPEQGRDLILIVAIISILLNPFLFSALDRLLARPEMTPGEPVAASEGTAGPREKIRADQARRPYRSDRPWQGRSVSSAPRWARGKGPLFVIEDDEEEVAALEEAAASRRWPAMPPIPRCFTAANLSAARCLLVAIPDAFEGGQVVRQARAINPTLPIIARAHSEEEIVHLKRHGANIVVMGEHEIAKSMLVNIGEAAPKRAKPRRRTRSD